MTKEQVLEWLLVFGRDWVSFREVNVQFSPIQKIKWAYDEHYLDHKPDDRYTHKNNNMYRLADKALALLEEKV